ncbi:hypothetical protein [Methylobacterium symbioticum]|jgi:hypothetical protein|uniref:Minor curlin subunit n=1 Tax=Methylobacterium symbioticum TaxID=2584084 RepID=A0A509EAD0_9HYPH|nr:hypothetical protein [Methylobacterium symbioticum]VUD71151.1 hypothetical protein MET9862_01727 [Methylobacterium symbioticum]
MPFSLTRGARMLRRCARAAAPAALLLAATAGAQADPVYVAQMANGVSVPIQLIQRPAAAAVAPTMAQPITPPMPTPEMAARNAGHQLAQTLQIGNGNTAGHLQVGTNNVSTAALIGSGNNLGVLQAGSNLQSNLVLVGTQGLSVGVIQPQGSAPINMLIARLPNGGLLIKR